MKNELIDTPADTTASITKEVTCNFGNLFSCRSPSSSSAPPVSSLVADGEDVKFDLSNASL